MDLKSNYSHLIAEIDGRANLVAITKNQKVQIIEQLYELGHRDFGENRVNILKQKSEYFHGLGFRDIRWHFIGQIQSKKVTELCQISGLFMVHSVCRMKILKLMIKFFNEYPDKSKPRIFLQFNISEEAQKTGIDQFSELELIYQFAKYNNYSIQGLMGMAAINHSEPDFSKLVSLRDSLDKSLELSMGMSQDYHIALRYGSNWLRLGSILYS